MKSNDTNYIKAINIIVKDTTDYLDDYRKECERFGWNYDIYTWQDYLYAIGNSSHDFKENVYYLLIKEHQMEDFTDDLEYITDDYMLIKDGLISYRCFMNDVRAELKKQGYLK